MQKENIRAAVRERYGEIAERASSCCSTASSCCESQTEKSAGEEIGYSRTELDSVPQDSNLGLGCGNPLALAAVKAGDIVLDLGSGAGFDSFLAAQRVGESGHVIGVDMTPAMLEKARANACRGDYGNVEFRLGEIENLPVADSSVDLVISNCVINLSVDKNRVFQEAYRVLKPGGRLVISDIVLEKELPEIVRESVLAYAGCIAGAVLKDRYLEMINSAGLVDVCIQKEKRFGGSVTVSSADADYCGDRQRLSQEEARAVAQQILSVSVSAVKPDQAR